MSNLLDTDFVSQGAKTLPDPRVERWLKITEQSTLFLSVVTLHEIQAGIHLRPGGRKRETLERWFERLVVAYQGRILEVTPAIAMMSGKIMAAAKLQGHTADLGDCLIAATAQLHGLAVATLNLKHYSRLGVSLLDLPE